MKPGEVSPQTFQKFDTDVPIGLNYYVLAQYLILLGATTFYLFTADGLPLDLRLLGCGFILWAVANLGAIFEARNWVFWSEVSRLITTPAFLVLTIFAGAGFWWPLLFSAVAFGSAIWFFQFRKVFVVPVGMLEG